MAVNINVPSQVKTYANLAAFPASGALKTIYIAEDTNKTYRWTGSVYVEVSAAGASGITIGTTAITSGTVGRVLFEGTGNVVQESANLFWDNTNGRLGIGTSSPAFPLDILGSSSIIGMKLRNSLSGGYTEINLFNNSGGTNDRMYMGVGGTTTGDAFQNRGYFFSGSNLEGINFTANKATTGDIRFFTGGVNERLRINGTGNVLINTTTDAGYKLDVNGTARFGNVFQATNANSITAGYEGGFVLTGGVGSLKQDTTTYNKTLLDCGYQGGLRIRPYSAGFTSYVDVRSDTSAALTVTSTNQGFLPPRMTTTQKNAIASPAAGLMVYDTTLNLISVYNGTTWITL